MWETLEKKDNIVYQVNSNITGNKKYQLVIPFKFRQKITTGLLDFSVEIKQSHP